MDLQEVVLNLGSFDDDAIICVKRPWSEVAPARVVNAGEDPAVPAEHLDAGFAYFLEVHLAKEVLELIANRSSTVLERIRLLVYYAENDAYPDWVYTAGV